MKKVFVETSVFMRFLTADDPHKFKDCIIFFEQIDQGKIRPYTSNIVLLEILFLLSGLYKFPKLKVIKDLGKILELRNLTLLEKTDTRQALRFFTKYSIKYADCLITTQIPPKTVLLTYDEDFEKFNEFKIATPGEII